LIFQSLLDPIEQKADNTHYYLDPGTTPAEFLPWLASWVGITLEPGLDETGQRELIRQAVELHRWKGTRRGLRDELRQRTGARALIVENFDGLRIGQDASLGLNTYLGAHREGCIAVTLAQGNESAVDHLRAEELVRDLKPAHVGHILRVVRAPGAGEGDSRG
jgi:phage tail-like protein